MIAKIFILAKEIRAMRTNNLRANKFFRDHGPFSFAYVELVSPAHGDAGFSASERRTR
jgi:hypothetical protein